MPKKFAAPKKQTKEFGRWNAAQTSHGLTYTRKQVAQKERQSKTPAVAGTGSEHVSQRGQSMIFGSTIQDFQFTMEHPFHVQPPKSKVAEVLRVLPLFTKIA